MAKAGISTHADNYAQWYVDIVDKADLAEPSGVVRGAMVIKPTGYAVWEGIQRGLDQRIKATIPVIPFDQPEQSGTCVVTGAETTRQVLFARSY